jgi:hypothetical protein
MCGWANKWTIFGGLTVYLAWLLPLAVDIYALIGFRVWLRSTTASETTRDFARKSTFAAIGLGVGGNAGYHLMVSLGWERSPWPVVVVVSALPPIMLGAVAHLSALRNRDHQPAPAAAPGNAQAAVAETTRETITPPPAETAQAPLPPAPKTNTLTPIQKRSETPKTTPGKTTTVKTQTTVKPTDEDHLKTIRETYAGWQSKTVSLGQIKTAIGISGQATAIRLRDALYPNGRPDQTTAADDDKEKALAGLDLPVSEPREPVLSGVNGSYFPTSEETR